MATNNNYLQKNVNAIVFSAGICGCKDKKAFREEVEECIEKGYFTFQKDEENLQDAFVISKDWKVQRIHVVPVGTEPNHHIPAQGERCLVVGLH